MVNWLHWAENIEICFFSRNLAESAEVMYLIVSKHLQKYLALTRFCHWDRSKTKKENVVVLKSNTSNGSKDQLNRGWGLSE